MRRRCSAPGASASGPRRRPSCCAPATAAAAALPRADISIARRPDGARGADRRLCAAAHCRPREPAPSPRHMRAGAAWPRASGRCRQSAERASSAAARRIFRGRRAIDRRVLLPGRRRRSRAFARRVSQRHPTVVFESRSRRRRIRRCRVAAAAPITGSSTGGRRATSWKQAGVSRRSDFTSPSCAPPATPSLLFVLPRRRDGIVGAKTDLPTAHQATRTRRLPSSRRPWPRWPADRRACSALVATCSNVTRPISLASSRAFAYSGCSPAFLTL